MNIILHTEVSHDAAEKSGVTELEQRQGTAFALHVDRHRPKRGFRASHSQWQYLLSAPLMALLSTLSGSVGCAFWAA